MMKKIILKVVIALVATLALSSVLISCARYDKDYAIYDLWVAGVKVTTRNQNDILGDGTVSYVGDRKSGVLTLNRANISENLQTFLSPS